MKSLWLPPTGTSRAHPGSFWLEYVARACCRHPTLLQAGWACKTAADQVAGSSAPEQPVGRSNAGISGWME